MWWDPHALDRGVEPAVGIRRESLIVKDVPDAVVAEGLRDYDTWRDARARAIEQGSMASLSVRTATEWAADEPSGEGAGLPPMKRPSERTIVQRSLFDQDDSEPQAGGASDAKQPDAAGDVLVVDHAYHGNLTSLVEISPYKFNGPGGRGRPEHVGVCELPDGYRGRFREEDPERGRRYAESAATIHCLARGAPA